MYPARIFNKLSYQRKKNISLFCFSLFVILVLSDMSAIYFDITFFETSAMTDLMIEIMILIIGILGFIILWSSTNRDERNQVTHQAEIQKLQEQVDHWMKQSSRFSSEFLKIVDAHFDIWGLTSAEREVGLYLLKGFNFEEIAANRNLSVRTIRNQASSIYTKSGLSGKHELAAFFLAEIL